LGDTLDKIAAEKAGIIKAGVPVVSGVRDGPARRIIEKTAHQHACPLATLGVDFDFRYRAPSHSGAAKPDGISVDRPPMAGGQMDFCRMGASNTSWDNDLVIRLPGRHQAANAAVALAVVDQLRAQSWEIPGTAVRSGLASAFCPARVEVVHHRPLIIVDGAHNAASVQALLETIDEMHPDGRRALVFATTRGKDTTGMLRQLMRKFDHVCLTRYLMNPRSEDPNRLLRVARRIEGQESKPVKSRVVEVCSEPVAAWRTARADLAESDLLCVTGSFFLAAELRSVILATED
jgi:dihydrofolate synthase/folylpolyglutamate synthase